MRIFAIAKNDPSSVTKIAGWYRMSVSDAGTTTEATYVWRADRRYRIGAAVAIVVLLALSVRVLTMYGYLAIIGVALVASLAARVWWVLLRPKLTAGPGGVQVVHGLAPVHVPWPEIRRCEPTPEGLKIFTRNGGVVRARYPQQPAGAAGPTEADAAAAYLVQRAAWARRPTGPMPVYVPPSTSTSRS
jgi:hypothetical protein